MNTPTKSKPRTFKVWVHAKDLEHLGASWVFLKKGRVYGLVRATLTVSPPKKARKP